MNEAVLNLTQSETSYAMLLNDKMDVIIHPNYPSGTRYTSYKFYEIDDEKYMTVANIMRDDSLGYVKIDQEIVAYSNLSNGWKLCVVGNIKNIYNPIDDLIFILIIVLIIAFLVTIFFSTFLGSVLSRNLIYLKMGIDEVKCGNRSSAIPIMSDDEVGELCSSFNEMSSRVFKSEDELKKMNLELETIVEEKTASLRLQNEENQLINKELTDVIRELECTQSKLIESEKNIIVKRIITGIAHEMNTPLGNGITLLSYNEANLNKIKKIVNDELVEETLKANNMALDSIMIAANLVDQLKRISFSKSDYTKIKFSLSEILNEYIKLKKSCNEYKNISFKLECDCEILLYSYHIIIIDIMDYLLMNSMQHGFDDIGDNEILISCGYDDEYVWIIFQDNGQGIMPDKAKDVFEPFYTTKHNEKSVGLGLYTVKKLIHTVLEGKIFCDAEFLEGARFKILIPRGDSINGLDTID